jgi:hypothetical protein
MQASVSAIEWRLHETHMVRDFGFDHGYVVLYGLPILVGIGLAMTSRLPFGAKLSFGICYAIASTLVGSICVYWFETVFLS